MSLNARLRIELVLVAILSACIGISLGQYANDSIVELAVTSSTANLSGIWAISGIESDQIIMALNQDGNDLYGAAKYEPDSGQLWNALAIGSIDGNDIHLALNYLENSTLISSKITGSYDAINQSMRGEFFQVSGDKISKKGHFTAIWINSDLSKYVPASIEEEKPVTQALQIDNKTTQETAKQTSRYYDVHQDSDLIMTGVCSSPGAGS